MATPSFAKYFGSGVIVRISTLSSFNLSECDLKIATAFIHLLSPGLDALTRPCLSDAWRAYVTIAHTLLNWNSKFL